MASLVLLVLAPPLLAPLLLAQQEAKDAKDPRARILQQALGELGDLADPVRARDAARRLIHLGAVVVEPLRERLRDPESGSTSARTDVIFVLGSLGRAALPALPELRDALRLGAPEVAGQAMWALGMLLPFADDDALAAVNDDLGRLQGHLRYDYRAVVLRVQVQLGTAPSPAALRQMLAVGGPHGIAACRWLCAHDDTFAERDLMLQPLRAMIEPWMARAPVSWQGYEPGEVGAAELAHAWLKLSREPLDAVIARALLDDGDAEGRMRALSFLRDHGAALPFRERADVVGRLWDSDAMVVKHTAEVLASWGSAGLVGLVPLRHHQRTHTDAAIAEACGAAAQALLAASAAMAEADRALLQAIDAVLQRKAPTPLAGKATDAGRQAIAELLFLAQWQAGDRVIGLLDLVEAADASSDDAIRSVAGWLRHDEAETVAAAFAWLARRGTATTSCVTLPLPVLARFLAVEGARASATEAMAWLDTAGCDATLLRELCDDDNLRIATRSLCALLQRQEATQLPSVERLRELAALTEASVVVRYVPRDPGQRVGSDVAAPIRVLAAIALADAKLPFPEYEGLAPLVQDRCGTTLASLQQHVATLRQRNELPALLDRLEAEIRERMGVDPHLRWPSAATAR